MALRHVVVIQKVRILQIRPQNSFLGLIAFILVVSAHPGYTSLALTETLPAVGDYYPQLAGGRMGICRGLQINVTQREKKRGGGGGGGWLLILEVWRLLNTSAGPFI